MRKWGLLLGLLLGIGLLPAVSAMAQIVPWLTVSPPFARPGDYVVFNVAGLPGSSVLLVYSLSSAGVGGGLPIGGDYQTFAQGVVGPSGTFTYPFQIPAFEGEAYFLAGVTPSGGGPMTFTNGAVLYVVRDAGNSLALADFVVEERRWCQPSGPTTLMGMEFRVHIGGAKPIKEAFLTWPSIGPWANLVVRLAPAQGGGPETITPSGYPFLMGWEFRDQSTDFTRVPDGTYTIQATFADGTTASKTVTLSGAFPAVPTWNIACGATGVSRTPTFSFSGATPTGQVVMNLWANVGQSDSVDLWRYVGTASSVTPPPDLLWPNQGHGIGVDVYGPRTASGARKGVRTDVNFTTGSN